MVRRHMERGLPRFATECLVDKFYAGVVAKASLQLPETGGLWFDSDDFATQVAKTARAVAKIRSDIEAKIPR